MTMIPLCFSLTRHKTCKFKKQLTLRGELCCLKLLNSSWCWAHLQSHLRQETWSLPSRGCCCMLPTYVFQHSLSLLQMCVGHRHTDDEKKQQLLSYYSCNLRIKTLDSQDFDVHIFSMNRLFKGGFLESEAK